MTRALCLGLIAVGLLAAASAPARADAAPWPFRGPKPPKPNPAPQPPAAVDPATDTPSPPPAPRDPPRRTGPFRSCGSGAGPGLAGIGAAWGMLWLGNRLVGRVSRRPKAGRAR
ncbi:MAG: hypothetical protein J0I06_03930 [Planctomycetes bacterium]|nr:hypothetical protein [Planctomycetota bacterium]